MYLFVHTARSRVDSNGAACRTTGRSRAKQGRQHHLQPQSHAGVPRAGPEASLRGERTVRLQQRLWPWPREPPCPTLQPLPRRRLQRCLAQPVPGSCAIWCAISLTPVRLASARSWPCVRQRAFRWVLACAATASTLEQRRRIAARTPRSRWRPLARRTKISVHSCHASCSASARERSAGAQCGRRYLMVTMKQSLDGVVVICAAAALLTCELHHCMQKSHPAGGDWAPDGVIGGRGASTCSGCPGCHP